MSLARAVGSSRRALGDGVDLGSVDSRRSPRCRGRGRGSRRGSLSHGADGGRDGDGDRRDGAGAVGNVRRALGDGLNVGGVDGRGGQLVGSLCVVGLARGVGPRGGRGRSVGRDCVRLVALGGVSLGAADLGGGFAIGRGRGGVDGLRAAYSSRSSVAVLSGGGGWGMDGLRAGDEGRGGATLSGRGRRGAVLSGDGRGIIRLAGAPGLCSPGAVTLGAAHCRRGGAVLG